MTVRRSHVLEDALRTIRRKEFSFMKTIIVSIFLQFQIQSINNTCITLFSRLHHKPKTCSIHECQMCTCMVTGIVINYIIINA